VGRKIDVTITYLEQRERQSYLAPPRPPLKMAILRAENPSVHFYRYLYRLVGDPYHWVSRRRLGDDELRIIISDPKVHLYVLYVGGVPAGLAEIDGRNPKTAELKFFGLAPEFLGRGLGRFFLTNAVDLAWSLGPKRVRLETCTLDHPAALPLYQKLGFTVFDQRKGQVELIDE
jgi:GNAT superfamily N-acetyltransferase